MANIIAKFRNDESGAALTEYLILLGLLSAAVATAVGTFGSSIETAFTGWGTFVDTNGVSG